MSVILDYQKRQNDGELSINWQNGIAQETEYIDAETETKADVQRREVMQTIKWAKQPKRDEQKK